MRGLVFAILVLCWTSVQASTRNGFIWPNKVVPYLVADSESPDHHQYHVTAMKAFQENTCLRFEMRRGENYYLYFVTKPRCRKFAELQTDEVREVCCHSLMQCVLELGRAIGVSQAEITYARQVLNYVNVEKLSPTDPYYPPVYRILLQNSALDYPYSLVSAVDYEESKEKDQGFTILHPGVELVTREYFTMFKDVNNIQKCHETGPCKDLKCVNDGFRVMANGKCACKCHDNLDPGANCGGITKHHYPVSSPGKSYIFIKKDLTYDEAVKECKRFNGYIAPSKTQRENDLLSSIKIKGKDIWLGASDAEKEGEFKWLDGTAMTWSNWDPSQPDDSYGEDCAVIMTNKLWNDVPCQRKKQIFKYHTICTIPDNVDVASLRAPENDMEYTYKFIDKDLSYVEAEKECEYFGGHIATAKNQREKETIAKMRKDNHVIWVGLSDSETKGQFLWNDGTKIGPIDYWAKGEPNNHNGKEECTIMNHNKKLNDFPCSRLIRVLCEIPVRDTPKALPTDKKYYFVNKHVTYVEAEKVCKKLNGRVATAKTAAENDLLSSMRTNHQDMWIGLTDIKHEGKYEWSDGTSMEWSNWNKGEPRNSRYENCIEMFGTKKWNDVPCNNKNSLNSFICELPIYETQNALSKSYFEVAKTYTYHGAELECAKVNGRIATAKNEAENERIQAERTKGRRVWIGATDRKTEGKYVWSDGTAMGWTNWNAGEPSNGDGDEHCLEMASNGKWNDLGCYADYITGVVCEIPGKAYKMIEQEVDYHTAEKECKKLNGRLATAKTPQEQTAVIAQRTKSAFYWIGASDRKNEGKFVWSDGTKMEGWTNWDSHNPDNYNNEDCVHIVANNNWNDIACTTKMFALCEIPRVL